MVTAVKENLIAISGAAEIQRLIDEYETDIQQPVAAGQYRQVASVRNHRSIRQPGQLIFIHCGEGRIIAANHNLLDILGYAAGELVAAGIDKIFMDRLEAQNLQAEVDDKGYAIDYRARLRKKDGSEVIGLVTSTIRWYNDESMPGNQPLFKSWVRLSR